MTALLTIKNRRCNTEQMGTGKNKYLPKEMLDEVTQIKKIINTDKDLPAFNELVRTSRLGREMEQKMKQQFFSTPMPVVPDEKKVKKRCRDEFDWGGAV